MSEPKKTEPKDQDGPFIFVTSYFHKGLGRRVFAREYGLKAFKIRKK